MKIPKEELGIVTAMLERYTKQRLPRLLEMKERLDRGEKLDDHDMEFLDMIERDRVQTLAVAKRHEDLHEIAMKAINLYHEITQKALQNERNA